MAGKEVIRNREHKVGFRDLPSWYTFRIFCLRSQLFLVQKYIAEIHFFHIISSRDEHFNIDPRDKEKALSVRSMTGSLEIVR